jgi:transposase-like protein
MRGTGLAPKMRQPVKTQNPLNGGLSHGIVSQAVTKEFKPAAVRRLEEGISIAEVARGLEVNPKVLHRWRREFRQGPGNAFPGNIPRMVELGQVSRSRFYRFAADPKPGEDRDMDLRDALQRIALEWRATEGRASPPSCAGGDGR